MQTMITARAALETDLREDLKKERLLLHYQPQVALNTGEVIAVEALVRWPHPRLGFVPPLEFLPLAGITYASWGVGM